MRKVIVSAMVSLDGVMQAPGGPEEDPTGGFPFGGWVEPLADEGLGEAIGEMFSQPFDLLLGRKTYDIFAAYWPYQDEGDPIGSIFDRVTKYVATRNPDLRLDWQNSRSLGADAVAAVKALKSEDGPVLLTQGSTDFLQTLFAHDLVDEMSITTFPVVLGKGKRLFRTGTEVAPGTFRLTGSRTTEAGTLVNRYTRAGEVKTGTFAVKPPSDAEIERRRTLV
ncbi:Dihydrofolate reductase [Nitratireductor aquibiodomus]|uniref:Dihydrofolate reductase n=1 Tax=Nitratireductor aquibiodomus TaxID=204799 RepID=A0A1H4KTR9_9HYPH|nr:dihydrofolate reductase family protein [Nitratireductor aquibiodomus]SEB61920.1 Dihydrofolate reductase [Nitratireductor aquibiodomus]